MNEPQESPENALVEKAQEFAKAANLVFEAGKLLQHINHYSHISLMATASALLEEAKFIEEIATGNPMTTGDRAGHGCAGDCKCKEELPGEINEEIESLVSEIEAMMK